MINLTSVLCAKTNAPTMFLIPGGPGLSSLTLRSLDILCRSFNLLYVDFHGTNDNPYTGKKSFEELSSELNKKIQIVTGRKFILGHSYGGFFAGKAFVEGIVDGLVCVATPFSKQTLSITGENYRAHMTDALVKAESLWSENQDDKSFAGWLSEYGSLYFKNPEGKSLLLNDKVSAQFFKDNRSETQSLESLLTMLAQSNGKKVFISGDDDKLLLSENLKKDSDLGKFDFCEIKNASHFVTFDQPERVASLIEEKLLT